MPIERRLLFENGTAYDIVATKCYIIRMYHEGSTLRRNENMPERYMSQIWRALDDIQYCDMVHEYIMHPFNGVLWPLDLWMAEFGVVDHALDMLDNGDDAATIGTFEADDLSIPQNDVIDLTEQSELSNAARLLGEIRNDVVDLTDMDEECIENDPEDMKLGWYLYEDAE